MSAEHKVASKPYQSTLAQSADPSSTASSVRTQIASCIPLLRFAARVRTRNRVEADALVEATLRTAAASIDEWSAKISAKARLLGIQRAVFCAGQVGGGGAADLSSKEAGEGPDESDANLHAALLQLPDHLREPLVLHDGAQCTIAEIADILACDTGTVERRVEGARCRLLELCETKSELGHSEPKSPDRDDLREADFKVFKTAFSGWKVQAISKTARDFVQRNLALEGVEARRGVFFTDRKGANDFLLYARMRGYMTDLIGPRGPARL
jgi:DNA-directed RNA polymerase specialized sigma24 family protein